MAERGAGLLSLEQVLTISEAAQRWALDASTVRKALLDGRLKGRKSAATWLICYDEMVRLYGAEPKSDK